MIVQRIDHDGTVREPYEPADPELAMAFVVLAMATADEPFSLRVTPARPVAAARQKDPLA